MTEYLINLIILLNDYFSLQDSLQARRVERSARTKAVGDLRTELRGAEVESESLQLQLRRDRQKMGGMIERSNELEQSIGAANGTNAGLAQLGAEMAVRGAGAISFHFHSMTEYSANFNAILMIIILQSVTPRLWARSKITLAGVSTSSARRTRSALRSPRSAPRKLAPRK